MEHATTLLPEYELGDLLGRGGFATVHAARHRTSRKCVAVKIVDIPSVLRKKGCAGENDGADGGEDELPASRSLKRGRSDGDNHLSSKGEEDPIASLTAIIAREISVHRSASSRPHPNVVSLLATRSCPRRQTVALVLEYCPRGDLQGYMKKIRDHRRLFGSECLTTFLPEREVKHAMRDVLKGLAFLHSRGIVHRDVKASNVFLCPTCGHAETGEDGVIVDEMVSNSNEAKDGGTTAAGGFSLRECILKIGDFGLAVEMADEDDWDEAQHTLCGTPSCLAPEVALSTPYKSKFRGNKARSMEDEIDSLVLCDSDEPSGNGHGQPADLWSAGCLMYAMIVGRYPFSSTYKRNAAEPPSRTQRVQETITRVVRGEWSIPTHVSVSFDGAALLRQLLELNPRERGFARGILSSHPFLKMERAAIVPAPNGKTVMATTEKTVLPPRPPNASSARPSSSKRDPKLKPANHPAQKIAAHSPQMPPVVEGSTEEDSVFGSHIRSSSHVETSVPSLQDTLLSCLPSRENVHDEKSLSDANQDGATLDERSITQDSIWNEIYGASRKPIHDPTGFDSDSQCFRPLEPEKGRGYSSGQPVHVPSRLPGYVSKHSSRAMGDSIAADTVMTAESSDDRYYSQQQGVNIIAENEQTSKYPEDKSWKNVGEVVEAAETRSVRSTVGTQSSTSVLRKKRSSDDRRRSKKKVEKCSATEKQSFESRVSTKSSTVPTHLGLSSDGEEPERDPLLTSKLAKKAAGAENAHPNTEIPCRIKPRSSTSISVKNERRRKNSLEKSAETQALQTREATQCSAVPIDMSSDTCAQEQYPSSCGRVISTKGTKEPPDAKIARPLPNIGVPPSAKPAEPIARQKDSEGFHFRNPLLDDDGDESSHPYRPKQERSLKFLNPIEGMHRLPPTKHHWKEVKRKTGDETCTKTTMFTAFILPNGQGLVIHSEDRRRRGIWMHVTGDGLRVCVGKLTGSPISAGRESVDESAEREDEPNVLMEEAFSRAPQHAKDGGASLTIANSLTMTTAGGISSPASATAGGTMFSFSTGVASYTAQTFPQYTSSAISTGRRKSSYKPLSSLLKSKHRKAYLGLYKALERMVESVKKSTPKITLYLHSSLADYEEYRNEKGKFSNDLRSHRRLIAKTMMMENSPFPDVVTTFVDGVTIRYHMGTGTAHLSLPQTGEESFASSININFDVSNTAGPNDVANTSILPRSDVEVCTGRIARTTKKYAQHISMAQSAAEQCLWTERWCECKQSQARRGTEGDFPVVKVLLTRGSGRDEWVDISSSDGGCSERGSGFTASLGESAEGVCSHHHENVHGAVCEDSEERKYRSSGTIHDPDPCPELNKYLVPDDGVT